MSKQKSARGATRPARSTRPAVPPAKGPNGAGNSPIPTAPVATGPARAEIDRRNARLERREIERAAAARRRRMLLLRNIAIGAGVLVLIGVAIAAAVINEANKPGESFPIEGSAHIASVTAAHAPYSTDPPTSGPHVPDVPRWGIYTTAPDLPLQVHGLEEGAVVINYQPTLDKDTLSKLEALTTSYGDKVILSPYQNLSSPIVLTAWTRMQKFSSFDEANIRRFIQAYRGIDHHKDSGS